MSTALQAIFQSARTTVDGGWRLSFDAYDFMSNEVIEISKLKGEPLILVVMTEKEYSARAKDPSPA